jgi:hypothetical protein
VVTYLAEKVILPVTTLKSIVREITAMILVSNEDIYSIVNAFENRTITKAEWTHAAHLVIGLYYCNTHPFAVAKNIMRDGICWLNDTHGVPNTDDSGYHETLTVFWLKRIWNFIDERPATTSLVDLANQLLDSFKDPKLPLRYYSRGLLFSTTARHDYVLPDLRPKLPMQLTTSLCMLKPLF